MGLVESSKSNNKEGCWVFPCINQVRKGPFGVTITAETLDESEPGRKTLDHRTDTIGVGVTHIFTWTEKQAVCEDVASLQFAQSIKPNI